MGEQSQLNRMESKIDAVNEKLDLQSNRITALETQGGMIKLGLTIILPVIGWILTHLIRN